MPQQVKRVRSRKGRRPFAMITKPLAPALVHASHSQHVQEAKADLDHDVQRLYELEVIRPVITRETETLAQGVIDRLQSRPRKAAKR